jgi:hypothetical protein
VVIAGLFGLAATHVAAQTVTVTTPAAGATVGGILVPVTATVSPALGPPNTGDRVDFYRDAVLINSDTSFLLGGWAVNWNTLAGSGVPNGTYTLTARAYNGGVLVGTSAGVSVTVNNGQATLTAPAAGPVSGTVPLVATVTPALPIPGTGDRVEFYRDAVLIGSDPSAPYNAVSWNTTTVANGTYTLTATGKDSSGNSVAISTEVQGVVDSVDLTSSPPLLSIGGQSYTTDKIKRVVRSGASS